MKILLLRLALGCASVCPLLRAEPTVWPAASQLESLHRDRNYAAVRVATKGLVFDSATQNNLTGAKLLFYRGDSLFREIHLARALQEPESEKAVETGRGSFELRYDGLTDKELVAALTAALDDLKTADGLNKLHNDIVAATLNSQFPRALGFAAMERALYLTQSPEDFYTASYALETARRNTGNSYAAFGAEPFIPSGTSPSALRAEIIALMAQGKEAEARAVVTLWTKSKDAAPLAYAALASAYDFVGEYERTRGLVLAEAMGQVIRDGRKFDPAHHAASRAVMRSHLNNLNFALQKKTEANVPALRAARVAGALALRGDLTDTDRAYILAVPVPNGGLWYGRPAQAGRLRAIRLQLDSVDPKEQKAGRAALDAALKITPDDVIAQALLGRCQLRSGETETAIISLSDAIKRDPFLAAVVGAHTDRASAYTKLGREAEAANDTRAATQLENLLGQLARP